MMKSRWAGFVFFLLAVSILGCSTAKVKQEFNLAWPPYPDDPKIALMSIYRNELDLEDRISLMDKWFGKESSMRLERPYGIFARDNKIYVADTNSAQVYIFDLENKQLKSIAGSANVKISMPIGVAVSASGTIYVSDSKEAKVFVFDNKGNYVTQMGSKDGLIRPTGLAIDDALARVYVADVQANMIFVFSLTGKKLMTIGKPGEGEGELHNPTNLAVNRQTHTLAVVDTSNFQVQFFDKDGNFISKFGQVGDTFGDFSRPKGIGIDSDGQVYVVDAAFHNFQIFSPEGQPLSYVGKLGVEPGTFQLPAGLYIDEQDRIYVTDQANLRVQVFQYFSETWKKNHPEEYQKYMKRQQ